MRVKAFDHLVLNVRDVERALQFYSETLGLEQERVPEWRAGKAPFPSVLPEAMTWRLSPHDVELLAAVPSPTLQEIRAVQGDPGQARFDRPEQVSKVILISAYAESDFADGPTLAFLTKSDLSAGAIRDILRRTGRDRGQRDSA
ncbi:VOC family protein [Nonomuraea sp. M3C6]|uniref:VOC family protein n=1 Tax=Nonomuraea marmarensis TaxID=3351344 RepID=A0ABW7ASM6_9ACTN